MNKILFFALLSLIPSLSFAQQTAVGTVDASIEGVKLNLNDNGKVSPGLDDDMIKIGGDEPGFSVGILPVRVRLSQSLTDSDGRISVEYLRAAIGRLVIGGAFASNDNLMAGVEFIGEGPGVELRKFFSDHGTLSSINIQIVNLKIRGMLRLKEWLQVDIDAYVSTGAATTSVDNYRQNVDVDFTNYRDKFCANSDNAPVPCVTVGERGRLNGSAGAQISVEFFDRLKLVAFTSMMNERAASESGDDVAAPNAALITYGTDLEGRSNMSQVQSGLEADLRIYKDSRWADIMLFARAEVIHYRSKLSVYDYTANHRPADNSIPHTQVVDQGHISHMITFGIKAVIW